MGLCKCPRRRVTNLFCFEHNVSVCEHCIVSEHPACVIKSYLHWLDDSDYDPTCPFPWCRRTLKDAECARLVCYHVFHWNCLNKHFTQDLPSNTAPAGYQCPLCKRCVFPDPNNASPVADALRKKLETVEWGRAGLSAGEMDSHNNNSSSSNADVLAEHHVMPKHHFSNSDSLTLNHNNGLPHLSGQSMPSVLGSGANSNSSYRTVTVNVSTVAADNRDGDADDEQALLPLGSKGNTNRISSKHRHHSEIAQQLLLSGNSGNSDVVNYDADAEKYQRRSFFNQLSRLFRNRFVISRRRLARGGGGAGPICKYICFILVIGLIVFLTGSMVLTGITRGRNIDDIGGELNAGHRRHEAAPSANDLNSAHDTRQFRQPFDPDMADDFVESNINV